MDELPAGIKPYPTVLQPQRGMANLAKLDAGNIEVERLPLNVQAVLRNSPAPLHELRVVLGRPIAGHHVNLSGAIDRLVHEIDVFKQLHIHGGDFPRVMATHDMIHVIQRRQIVLPRVITITDSQSFIRMHVEKCELGIRKLIRPRGIGQEKPASEQQEPGNRCFQEGPASPRPGIWMLQRTAPGENALQSVEITPVLVSKVPGSVNSFPWKTVRMFLPHPLDRKLSSR